MVSGEDFPKKTNPLKRRHGVWAFFYSEKPRSHRSEGGNHVNLSIAWWFQFELIAHSAPQIDRFL